MSFTKKECQGFTVQAPEKNVRVENHYIGEDSVVIDIIL